MNVNELEIEMVEIVKKTLVDLRLQKPIEKNETQSEYGEVTVYAGFPLPTTRGKENEDIPLIVLRASDGSDKEDSTITKINMEILTYKNDDKLEGYIGHRNAIMIWEKIRQYLRKNRHSGLFEYVESKWEILKLDGAFSGLAVDISFKLPLIGEESDHINGMLG